MENEAVADVAIERLAPLDITCECEFRRRQWSWRGLCGSLRGSRLRVGPLLLGCLARGECQREQTSDDKEERKRAHRCNSEYTARAAVRKYWGRFGRAL